MTLLQHEIDYIAGRLNDKIAERLGGTIRAIIEKEMKRMTDQAVTDLTAATDAIVAELGLVVTALQADAVALAAALAAAAAGGAALDPAIEAQTKRLVDGTAAAKAAVQALQAPASPASPLPSPAPAPAAPAATA